MIFDWLTPTYPTIALPWTPISRLYNAEKFSLFNGGSHFWKAKKVTSNSKKLIFFNAFHFIIPKGRQLRGSRRIDLSIKYFWLALLDTGAADSYLKHRKIAKSCPEHITLMSRCQVVKLFFIKICHSNYYCYYCHYYYQHNLIFFSFVTIWFILVLSQF